MRFRSLVMALLLVSLFAQAAGAIYIPGQEIPDDGKPHILSADGGGPDKRYLSSDPSDYVLVPGNDPDMMYALGRAPVWPDMAAPGKIVPAGMPSYVSKLPSMPAMPKFKFPALFG